MLFCKTSQGYQKGPCPSDADNAEGAQNRADEDGHDADGSQVLNYKDKQLLALEGGALRLGLFDEGGGLDDIAYQMQVRKATMGIRTLLLIKSKKSKKAMPMIWTWASGP